MKITPYCVFNGKRCNEWLNWVNLKVKLKGVICNLIKKKKNFENKEQCPLERLRVNYVKLMGWITIKGHRD